MGSEHLQQSAMDALYNNAQQNEEINHGILSKQIHLKKEYTKHSMMSSKKTNKNDLTMSDDQSQTTASPQNKLSTNESIAYHSFKQIRKFKQDSTAKNESSNIQINELSKNAKSAKEENTNYSKNNSLHHVIHLILALIIFIIFAIHFFMATEHLLFIQSSTRKRQMMMVQTIGTTQTLSSEPPRSYSFHIFKTDIPSYSARSDQLSIPIMAISTVQSIGTNVPSSHGHFGYLSTAKDAFYTKEISKRLMIQNQAIRQRADILKVYSLNDEKQGVVALILYIFMTQMVMIWMEAMNERENIQILQVMMDRNLYKDQNRDNQRMKEAK